MRVFLDSSVILAAGGSASGASRAVVEWAPSNRWILRTSDYNRVEVERNLPKLGAAARRAWAERILPRIEVVPTAPLVAGEWAERIPAKDLPVVLTAVADASDVLLTLDRKDFGPLMKSPRSGLRVSTPGDFLETCRRSPAGLVQK
ncbi:MAG: hypothetical protein BWK77_05840 [Verrucomicrobia bacterium A1]|nr:MAG: hypothetical protein BWK77_05840 [Verrucomicrobia bacterium A1]